MKTLKTNWKFLLIVLILAAVVGGGSLYYSSLVSREISLFVKQILQITKPGTAPDETAGTSTSSVQDWQTYRNEEFGFEVKYPDQWIIDVYKDYFGYKSYNVRRLASNNPLSVARTF